MSNFEKRGATGADVASDYPAYELYTTVLRAGIFQDPERQLRLVVGRNRRVTHVERI